ncbi:imidazolonepropionase [Telluria aromaticivorans]|uniref:Imidazolonepropionase n=1 Tax=Telluria aromaticivorans TaxID=2725995 RepID=A0A7Y2K247_9BURK|nr:imidazolonepropionase [Telluria aromaticivorans]NNG25262.1 imidazolonepropionase [Telluria aromaticivorans]
MSKVVDLLFTNVRLATMVEGYGEMQDAALAVKDGRIAWLGARSDAPAASAEHDCGGMWMTPGLVDCHTHIVHAGNRSNEWEARLNGATYEDIARQGGGIMSTVRATRQADVEALLAQSLPRVAQLLSEGVTTIEIKSGYGLELAAEGCMLRAARQVAQRLPVRVATTFLGAHALPPEFAGRPEAYVDELCERMLPQLAEQGLVDAVDAFCERIGFSYAQTERLFAAARTLGLPVKLHAEQLSDQGGAELVARYGGLSADHLEHLTPEGIDAMARAGTVAVLLPGAYYFLRETVPPPIAALREAGVPMAVATDCNPGTSPMSSLLLAMNMACTLWRLTPQEALQGATTQAARALGLQSEIGTLEVGKVADLALWDIARPADLAYAMGFNPCRAVVNGGVLRPAHISAA